MENGAKWLIGSLAGICLAAYFNSRSPDDLAKYKNFSQDGYSVYITDNPDGEADIIQFRMEGRKGDDASETYEVVDSDTHKIVDALMDIADKKIGKLEPETFTPTDFQ